MILIRCPYCEEERAEVEFTNAGEAHIARPDNPDILDDQQWSEFLFTRQNPRGLHFERWIHSHGCARFFNAVRHTVTDKFIMTYKANEPRPTPEQLEEAQK